MRTKEEKEKIINDFKASGLTMSKWCKENNFATSTLSTWLSPSNNKMKKRKTKGKSTSKAKFVEVIPSTNTNTSINRKVTVEYNNFKISIEDSLDVLLLKDVLKVVTQLNV